MSETPTLSETEYRERITELAKHAIREHCVDDDGAVEYRRHAADEVVRPIRGTCSLLEDYPLSIEAYGSGSFTVDDAEYLASATPKEAIERARVRMLIGDVDDRVQELLDGEWDAVQTTTETRTVTETRTTFEE